MAHIDERADFSFIRYANCWEDAEVLCQALSPAPGKRFLSIASAGDNSLALLTGGAEVIAVDLNSTQLACTEIRREAIRELDYDTCLEFLGFRESKIRCNVYKQFKNNLSESAREFWDANTNIIQDGIIHNGKFEKYFQFFRKWVISTVHTKERIQNLLTEKELEERLEYYARTWDNRRWRILFKIFFSRLVMGKMGRDPEFFRYVDVPVAESILKRTRYALSELPTHDNPYLEYILTSKFENNLPFYMQKDNFELIKKNIDNLKIKQGAIQEVAELDDKGFDGFNLSDLFEYLPEDIFKEAYDKLLNSSNKGAIMVYWNMLVPRSCPEEFTDMIDYKKQLSEELFAKDKAWFYSRFIVEEVV